MNTLSREVPIDPAHAALLIVDVLIVTGMMTDQCVESAVRDACDLGYLVPSSPTHAPPTARNAASGRSSASAATAASGPPRRCLPRLRH
jgi:nicotinamidase-related amidase